MSASRRKSPRRAPAARKAKKALTRSRPQKVPAALLGRALRGQSEGVFIARTDLRRGRLLLLFVNDGLCNMTGRPAKQLVGRSQLQLHPDPAEVDRLARWLPTARPAHPLTGEGYLSRADGRALYAAWTYDAMCDSHGRVTHVVATYRDTTERRRLQEALVHAQRLDAVGRLAGGVAHDFNNLISVVNGYCQILASQMATEHPQLLHQVEEIHKAGQKAAALTRQLLAFGRRQPMNARVINLNHVVRDNTEILQRLLSEVGTLELQLDAQLGNVRADPGQLQQVLLNLVLNSRDALRPPGRVVITTANRTIRPGLNRRVTDAPPGRYVALIVTDNGVGMDAETQSHLFEPFFTTKEEGKGSGLGLPLVYGVVQQSGGYIAVQSTVFVGSSFEILLPEVDEPAEIIANAPLPTLPTLPATKGSESVLLVEADPVVRKMVAGILTSDGYRVFTASDARSAMTAARGERHEIQLLIANINGPDRACERLAHALELIRPGLRILNTGTAEDPSVYWVARAPHIHLPKPFALSELLKATRQLLDTKPEGTG